MPLAALRSTSRAVTVTTVSPTCLPVTVRSRSDTAAVAMLRWADAALNRSSSPSGSAKWAPRSTAAEVASTWTVTAASAAVTAGAVFTVTVNESLASPPRPSAAVTVTPAVPRATPPIESVPVSPSTVADAVPGASEVAR